MLMERYPELRYERWLPGVLRSIKRSNGIVYDERLLRGPRGHPLCLWCSEETATRQALFCAPPSSRPYLETEFGQGCAHEHRMRRDNQYVRRQLFLRDGGICYDCGVDTNALFEQAVACTTLSERIGMFKMLARRAPEWKKKAKRPLASMEYEFTKGMFWEAAHKVDVKHGGGLCGLDGFQTLCVPCHNDEYMRSYLADISNISLFQSPTGVLSDADTPPVLLSAGRGGRGFPSAQLASQPRFALSPIQMSGTPVATAALASRGRPVADLSPISLSSTSSSSLPSPTGTYILCVPPCPHLQESPSGSPAADLSMSLGSLRCRRTAVSPNVTPSKSSPVQLSAVIDLTASTREPSSHVCDRQDIDLLTNMLTTINISSSGEESTDEVEIVRVVSTRQPLATRKQGNASTYGQAGTRQQQQQQKQHTTAARAKDRQPTSSASAAASEDRVRPRLAQKSMSENASTLQCPSRTRVSSSRLVSLSQENSPAARGLVPLTSDASVSRRQLKDKHTVLP
ncbi:hypothetical protein GGF38_000033 [Coemansia sp. RSA 25]|nr:hypothetical protein GGF38_000033 [Coemansia sp. RSA 25]